MFKKCLVITALFCATQFIQSADNQSQKPPTDKNQPSKGSLARVRPQSAAGSTLQTPPAATPTDNLPSYNEYMQRTALSLMLPDASQPTPPASTSPNAPGSPLPTMVAEPVKPQVQRPRSSGKKPPIPSFWAKDTPKGIEGTQTTLAPRKPAGSKHYVLGSRTNLLPIGQDQPTQSAASSEISPERAEALKLYKQSQALLGELTKGKVNLFDFQNQKDLENLKDEAEETGSYDQFLEWIKSFYAGLLEQKAKHEKEQEIKDYSIVSSSVIPKRSIVSGENKKTERRETIQRSRSALGLGDSSNVLFQSPDSTPTALVASPDEPGEVFCEVFEIPERKKMQEAREKLALLLNEYGTTESTARKNEISREIESIIQLNKKLLITKEISQIIGAVSC